MPQFNSAVAVLRYCVNETTKEITTKATRALFRNTPKRTTLAASSWIAQLGRAQVGHLDIGDGKEATRAALVPGQKARQELGLLSIRFFDVQRHGRITITNDVPYIGALERGSSSQRPSGFIPASIAEAVRL